MKTEYYEFSQLYGLHYRRVYQNKCIVRSFSTKKSHKSRLCNKIRFMIAPTLIRICHKNIMYARWNVRCIWQNKRKSDHQCRRTFIGVIVWGPRTDDETQRTKKHWVHLYLFDYKVMLILLSALRWCYLFCFITCSFLNKQFRIKPCRRKILFGADLEGVSNLGRSPNRRRSHPLESIRVSLIKSLLWI